MWVLGWVPGRSPNPVAVFQLLPVEGPTWLLAIWTPPRAEGPRRVLALPAGLENQGFSICAPLNAPGELCTLYQSVLLSTSSREPFGNNSQTSKTGRHGVKAAALEPCSGMGSCSWWGKAQLRAELSPSSVLVSPPHQPQHRGPFASIPGGGGGIGAGMDEGCTVLVHAWRSWMGPFPSRGCPPLHQSRITTRTAPALTVNEITATAWSLRRRQRSGHDPVSIRIHGNIATYFNGRRAAGQLFRRVHLAGGHVAPSKAWPGRCAGSWAALSASGKPAHLQPPKQDLGDRAAIASAEPFAGAPFLPGTWLTPHQGWYFAIPSKQQKSTLRGEGAGNACWKGCASLFGAWRGRWSCGEPSPQPGPPLPRVPAMGWVLSQSWCTP